MKTTLTISVVLNVLLLGGGVMLYQSPVRSPKPKDESTVQGPESRVREPVPALVPPPTVKTVAVPFHWSQLVNTNDYRVFVANLRAAGCPEATVEDIVQGDTERVYAMMRGRLGVSAMEPGRWSGQAQAQMVAYLLGQTPSVEEAPTELAASGQNIQTTNAFQTGTTALTEFLQNADLTTPGMSAEQQQEIAGLRQGLLAQISATRQALNNQTAQSSSGNSDIAASSQAGPDNSQASADNSQPSQTGTGNPRLQRTAAQQALIQASQEESILGGLFGIGAAIQYDQSQAAQSGQN